VGVCSLVGPDEGLVLLDATPVRLRLSRNLSSADTTVGEAADFEVLDEVKIGDALVIGRGDSAIATVTNAEPKKRMARGSKKTSGRGHTGGVRGRIGSDPRHRVLSGRPVLPFHAREGYNDSEGDRDYGLYEQRN
jgi:hypothetical protein